MSDYLMEGWTPDEAYEWILKQGLKGQSTRVMGIDDLRSELAAWRQNAYDKYNPRKALDEIKDELAEIVSRELAHLKEALPADSAELKERERFLNGLDSRPGQGKALRTMNSSTTEAAADTGRHSTGSRT
jgi:uncharacterized protein with von Willebrand factor type A (vWA) domain